VNRTITNLIVDAVAFVAFLFLATTGVLMHFALPAGSGHFKTLCGMDRHQWGEFHFWIAVAMAVVVTLHLCLHWRWIVCTIQGRRREGAGIRLTLAVVAALSLVGIAVSPFFATVQGEDGTPPHRIRSGEQPNQPTHQITGSMTLQEVEQHTGVPVAVIVKELGLPKNVPTDEQLGRLRRKYGFEMEDVRQIVQRHAEERPTGGKAP
jgi:hypothetical protein